MSTIILVCILLLQIIPASLLLTKMWKYRKVMSRRKLIRGSFLILMSIVVMTLIVTEVV